MGLGRENRGAAVDTGVSLNICGTSTVQSARKHSVGCIYDPIASKSCLRGAHSTKTAVLGRSRWDVSLDTSGVVCTLSLMSKPKQTGQSV